MKIAKNVRQLIILWLFAIPQFLLGLAIVDYLGAELDWLVFWLGLIWVILIAIISVFLFMFSNEMLKNPQQIKYMIRQDLYRNWLLVAGFVLILLFICTLSLVQMAPIGPAAALFMFIIFLGSFFLSVSPPRLYYSGYGELVLALIIGFFIPALSLQMQIQELHRLLIFSSIPITLLMFSFQLIYQIADFREEIKVDEKRIIGRIGWENGFVIHNSFIILAYLTVGVAGLLGLPRSIAIPVFLSFPLAGLQIWHLQQISNGSKPSWKFLRSNNILIVSTVMIVFIFSYLIR